MNSRSTSWATLLALAQDQTLDSELFVSQRTPNLFWARNAKPNETEVGWMGLNVSNNSLSISCMQVLTKPGFSGTVSVPPREKPCRTKVTCSPSSAGGMELEGAAFVSLPALEPAQLPWVQFYTEPSWKLLPAVLAQALLASLGTGWISWTWTLSMCYHSK